MGRRGTAHVPSWDMPVRDSLSLTFFDFPFNESVLLPRGWGSLSHWLIPIVDSEPVSIVKPAPPVAAGQGLGCQARTTTPLGAVECAE